jgi:hypothetical protein
MSKTIKHKSLKELQKEFPEIIFIDPTDNPSKRENFRMLQDITTQQLEYVINIARNVKAKSNEKTVNPDFFEKTAEEKAEQNALGIDTEKFEFFFAQDEFPELFADPCLSMSAETLENDLIQEIMARGRRFSHAITPFTFYHTDDRPSGIVQHKDLGMFAMDGKGDFDQDFIKKHLDANPIIFPNKGKKADYKNKTYKNTAKKAKPSSILLGLIRNNNK